jgi:hypothetical protein
MKNIVSCDVAPYDLVEISWCLEESTVSIFRVEEIICTWMSIWENLWYVHHLHLQELHCPDSGDKTRIDSFVCFIVYFIFCLSLYTSKIFQQLCFLPYLLGGGTSSFHIQQFCLDVKEVTSGSWLIIRFWKWFIFSSPATVLKNHISTTLIRSFQVSCLTALSVLRMFGIALRLFRYLLTAQMIRQQK